MGWFLGHVFESHWGRIAVVGVTVCLMILAVVWTVYTVATAG